MVDLSLGATFLFGAVVQDAPERPLLLACGLSTLAVGIPMLAVDAAPVRYKRQSEPAYAIGSVLASTGATLTGFGVGSWIGEQEDWEESKARRDSGKGPDFEVAYGVGIVGALLGFAGAGLMTYGALEAAPDVAAASDHEEPRGVSLELRIGAGTATMHVRF